MGFNATFNNISVISWQPVLLVEETGVSKRPPLLSGQMSDGMRLQNTPKLYGALATREVTLLIRSLFHCRRVGII
jgi:hypothetical protein